ncbi:MAG: hypothetical protein ACI8Z1_000961 [Candidatus Azotimanducaceae bacterium]|jgi:hypothetical protein
MITTSLKSLAMLSLAACLYGTQVAAAGIPEQLPIQSVVNDSASDLPIDGILDVRFTLYDATGRVTSFMNAGGGFIDPTGLGASVI